MCGRYTLASSPGELVETFDVPDLDFELVARYNIAPGQTAPVVGEDRRGRRIGLLRWGFLPSDAREAGGGWVNARAESASRRRTFREAFAHRRCLVPADGFYEWMEEGGGKIPHWFHPRVGGLLSFAAIWEHWERPGLEPRDGFAILTVDANADVRPVHERMPAIVAPADRDAWLDRSTPTDVLGPLLAPAPDGSLDVRVVSKRVNAAREDDPGLLDPV